MAGKCTRDRSGELLTQVLQLSRDTDAYVARRAAKTARDRASVDAAEEGRIAAAKVALGIDRVRDMNRINRDFWAEHQRRMEQR